MTSNNTGQPVTSGDWRVTLFTDSGDDETNDFSGYTFYFSSEGTLKVAKNGTVTTGTWSKGSKFNIDPVEKATYNALVNSITEIEKQPGRILVNKQATKQAFLQYANHYPVIHLATHASVNGQDPQRSFITFFPGSKDNRLYAREIYDLRLDSTKLVILSACETGSGKLVRGEGMMSLSRAFAYAGCPNIITSLWKAEDRTTAFIAQRLHEHLNRGYTRDKALQQAKIDLLKNPDIGHRFKTPNYWSQLVLIDVYEPGNKKRNGLWWLVVPVGIAIVVSLQRITVRKI